MKWPWARKTSQPEQEPDTLVVCGVHHEELAFGQQATRKLDRGHFESLAIVQGLSAKRPTPDRLDHYLDAHARLYEQIATCAKPHHRLVIDLHCRLKDTSDADIFCAHDDLLDKMREGLWEYTASRKAMVRFIRMVTDQDIAGWSDARLKDRLFSKPEIPEEIWRPRSPIYVGVEIYLQREGRGKAKDWLLARHIIETIRTVLIGSN